MFLNSGKIIEALATIKADTANHKDDLKNMKKTFDKHIEKEEIRQVGNHSKMEAIYKELIAAAERKADEIKDRAEIDKDVAKDISSLQTRSKYNLLSMAGLWSVMGIILKKLFMP